MNANNKLRLDIIFLIINIVLLLLIIISFSGCAQKDVVIQREQVKKIPLNLSNPTPLKINDVNYIIITDKNVKDVFEQMKKESKEQVLFAIDYKDYEDLSLNLAYIRKYIIEQQEIIKTYKHYYEPTPEEIKPQKLQININKN